MDIAVCHHVFQMHVLLRPHGVHDKDKARVDAMKLRSQHRANTIRPAIRAESG